MTITSPEYLYDNSGGTTAWGSTYSYKLRSQTTSFATYDLWDPSGSGDWYSGTKDTGGWAIKVGIDPSDTSNYNKWVDGYTGGYQPTIVQDPIDIGGTDVKLWSGADQLSFQFTKPTVADWISSGNNNNNNDTNTEGVNTPSVTWDSNPVCGQQSYLGVVHSESQQTGTTYYVYDSSGQIGTVTVGVNAYLSPPFWFTVESGLISVQDSNGTIIGSKVFTCGKRGSLNFW